MATWDYEYANLIIEFHYDYEPGEPMIWSYPNGDPGHPGSDPSVTLHKAMLVLSDVNGKRIKVDIWPLKHHLYDIDTDEVEAEILEYHESE